jgi:hypothetical protein
VSKFKDTFKAFVNAISNFGAWVKDGFYPDIPDPEDFPMLEESKIVKDVEIAKKAVPVIKIDPMADKEVNRMVNMKILESQVEHLEAKNKLLRGDLEKANSEIDYLRRRVEELSEINVDLEDLEQECA